jgi:DnaA-homolog protein
VSFQLPLALQVRHAPTLDDFVVGANAVVLDQLRRALGEGGERLILVCGPSGSGRTHLLLGQCQAAEANGFSCGYVPLNERAELTPAMLDGLERLDLLAIDDIDAIAGDAAWEGALFTLFNRCRELDTRLLFSASGAPGSLPVALPDLRSRLAWGLTVSLQPLDDAGRRDLLQRLADRRAMAMPDEVARYLLARTVRHPKALVDVVAQLDQASLARRRRLTIPFVRETLGL